MLSTDQRYWARRCVNLHLRQPGNWHHSVMPQCTPSACQAPQWNSSWNTLKKTQQYITGNMGKAKRAGTKGPASNFLKAVGGPRTNKANVYISFGNYMLKFLSLIFLVTTTPLGLWKTVTIIPKVPLLEQVELKKKGWLENIERFTDIDSSHLHERRLTSRVPLQHVTKNHQKLFPVQ